MNRKHLTAILSLIAILTFLLAACGTASTTSAVTAATTEVAEQTANTSSTDATATDASSAAPAGNPPSGAPPAGNPPPGAGTGGASIDEGLATATGTYTLDGQAATLTGQTYNASSADQSGVYVINGGNLTLSNSTITTSGDTSSDENSSFYGLNAGVLANNSTITLTDSSINTSGTGANGAFAVGSSAVVNLTNVTITATGDGGHGVMATQGGTMTLTNVTFNTSGAHSAPIATDRGGGTITSTGDIITTTGTDSPCYYSTGTLTASNATCNATGSEAVVIEGANSVILTNSSLTSSVADKWGVMIYQSFSGDAQGSDGVFNMTGGSLSYTAANGPLFYVTNTNGTINLAGVTVSAASGILVRAEGNDRWGTSGSNGGTVFLTADGQTLTGDLSADDISSISADLKNGSALVGGINTDGSSATTSLTLDSSSAWTVTADSHITSLTGAIISGNTITNIIGNGHIVYYDAASCPELGGLTYTLSGGGTLQPAN